MGALQEDPTTTTTTNGDQEVSFLLGNGKKKKYQPESTTSTTTRNTFCSPKEEGGRGRWVLLQSLALILVGLLLGSVVTARIHGRKSSTNDNPPPSSPATSDDDDAAAAAAAADTATTIAPTSAAGSGGSGGSGGGEGVQPNDFDGDKIKNGTTLADMNHISAPLDIASGCETTVVIIRHCEKQGPDVADQQHNQHCSYVGHQRAHYLTTLFGNSAATGSGTNQEYRWPAPTLLYALTEERDGRHWVNYREVETLQPLAEKLGLDIIKHDTNQQMANELLPRIAKGQLCSRVVLISWEHSIIGDLASHKLGCHDCPTGGYKPDTEFDQVWLLRYVYDVLGTPVFQEKHPIIDDNQEDDDNKKHHNDNGKKRYLKTGGGNSGNAKTKAKAASTAPPKQQSKSSRGTPTTKQWSIFSTITKEYFDPLKYSNSVGDYDGSGQPGGKWLFTSSSVSSQQQQQQQQQHDSAAVPATTTTSAGTTNATVTGPGTSISSPSLQTTSPPQQQPETTAATKKTTQSSTRTNGNNHKN